MFHSNTTFVLSDILDIISNWRNSQKKNSAALSRSYSTYFFFIFGPKREGPQAGACSSYM